MITLLHLSDLHFGSDHAFAQQKNREGASKVAEAIRRVLDDNQIRVDHLIFTGDFFSHDQTKNFFQARAGIAALKDVLHLADDNLSFVPGNHDLSWDPDFTTDPFVTYNELVTAFGRKECLQSNLPAIIRISPDTSPTPVFLALLDSCTVEGKELAGIGNIGEVQLDQLKLRVREKTKGLDKYVLIAALHHHLLPIYPVEKIVDHNWPKDAPKGRSSHTLDAVDVLNELSELNTTLVIHGHQHRPAVISYQNKLTGKPPLTIAASGSSGSKDDERQFYLYEIDDYDIHIRSFMQPKSNTRFVLDNRVNLSVPIPQSSKTNDFCKEDAEYRHHAPRSSEMSEGDYSDLHLLFLSVKDCERSRQIVRRFVAGLSEPSSCNIHGMYDLLGHWDLLVRLRCPGGSFDANELHRQLLKAGQMESAGPDFVGYQHINVMRETKTFKEQLSTAGASRLALDRRVLGRTEDYDSKRCQRGLLYIRLPASEDSADTDARQEEMIRMLARTLDSDPVFKAIVEGVYKGKNDLVIESFMTCAQSQAMNYLNRRIESILTKYELQKYTMFVFVYDELEIIPPTVIGHAAR